jgi:hypothetical protein
MLACTLALLSAQANAQAGATPPVAVHEEAEQTAVPIEPQHPAANPPTPMKFVGPWSKPRRRTACPSNFSLASSGRRAASMPAL